MSSVIVLGIDPGVNGGLVLLDKDFKIINKLVMPRAEEGGINLFALALWVLSNKQNITSVYLEEIHALYGVGAKQTFQFGRFFGAIEGLLSGIGIPYNLVPPKTWQKDFHLKYKSEKNPKKRSFMAYKELYPNLSLKRTEKCKIEHDGLVDALLIATYGIMRENNK